MGRHPAAAVIAHQLCPDGTMTAPGYTCIDWRERARQSPWPGPNNRAAVSG